MLRHPRTTRYVDWVLRHGSWLWLLALLAAVPAAVRTAWLYSHLDSQLEELLPRNAPSVVAVDELRRRVGGIQYLGVVVDAGSADALPAAERFLDDLAARVRAYPRDLVRSVRTGKDEEQAYLRRYGALYLDTADLETIRDRVEARRDYEVAKETGNLLDQDEPPPPADFRDIQDKYARLFASADVGRDARFSDPKTHVTVLLVELPEYSSGTARARRLLDRVQADVAELGGVDAYAPGMRLGFAGDAAATVEELSALVSDISLSSVLVVLAVLAVIAVFYGSWRSVPIVLAPVILAAFYAFGLASLPPFRILALNSNTAFLGAIILGNGLNPGLVLLARYVEERRTCADVPIALAQALAGARNGTLAAALAACTSYGALAFTQFRGFQQFGVVGALGMLLTWATTFVLMPPLAAWFDGGTCSRWRSKSERGRLSYWIARLIARAPRMILACAAVFTAVATAEVASFRSTDMESDLSHLRRRDTWTSGEGYWSHRMDAVLGGYLTPFAFLADDAEEARRLADLLRREKDMPPISGRIARVRTIDDLIPQDQTRRLAIIAALRSDLTPAVLRSLAPAQRDYVDRLFAPDAAPHPIGPSDLPAALTIGLRENDGSYDKIVLAYPNPSSALWKADVIRDLVGELRAVARRASDRPTPARVAGPVALSADILAAIGRDGPRASAFAFGGVLAIVLLLLRGSRSTLYVAGALLTGVLWMAGLGRVFHVKLNFANLMAFPITFGIGVDYAVNVVTRHAQDGGTDVLHAVRSTGAAVALCSLTTILGYSSLLVARNHALFLFGLLADLGEVSCLTAALVALPAVIFMLRR